MKDRILAFLKDIDASLVEEATGKRLRLYHIGRSALVWKYNYLATTQDVDVICPESEDRILLDTALGLFGKGTPKADKHGLFLEEVNSGLPPMPYGFRNRATKADGPWVVIELYHLDPYDLVASKLRRFAAKDRADIQQLCDWGEVSDPVLLEAILEKAFPFNLEKDGDPFRDVPFANLRVVQRYIRGEIAKL